MFDKTTLDSLTIDGKNNLRDISGFKISDNPLNHMPTNEISNYIMNSNLDNGNIIK